MFKCVRNGNSLGGVEADALVDQVYEVVHKARIISSSLQ